MFESSRKVLPGPEKMNLFKEQCYTNSITSQRSKEYLSKKCFVYDMWRVRRFVIIQRRYGHELQ
jgi:hypothetical protein